MINQLNNVENTTIDMAKVLSTVFDVIFKINDNGRLEHYDIEQAIFNRITSVKNIANKRDSLKILHLINRVKEKKKVNTMRIKVIDRTLRINWADVFLIRYDKDDTIFMALKDITEGQRQIENLSEAGVFDPLTGAYYRSKLRDLLDKIDAPNNLPIAFFMFDVNGMKIINDIFGYDEGNNLLVKCATIISLAAPSRAIMVRMSGDEFLLMVPRCSRQERQYIVDKVNEFTKEEATELITPDISMSVGYKEMSTQSIDTALRKTEEKLISIRSRDSLSFKNTIVKDLLRYLAMKNFETTKHVLRVRGLSLMLGESLGLDQEEMNTLSLAADIHDIGKVLVPEHILSKKGNLTKEEWKEIKLHPVTSFSIANALPKYKCAANAILYHHENWNGTGYPEGLLGDRIPLLSRILSIADAYDIMQNTTYYRTKKYSASGALREIRRCAGTQFDPNLVRIFSKIMDPR